MVRSMLALSASSLAIGLISAATGAMAQEADGETIQRTNDVITVTARKREETAQDVPVTLDAFGEEDVEDFDISSLEDIESMITGAEFIGSQGDPYQTEIIIRGGGVARQLNVDSGTGLYFNGISIQGGNVGGRSISPLDTFDMQRVEVLKGPQGALYGRNALGGAINMISKRPNLDRSKGQVSATIADNKGYGLEAYTDIVAEPGKAAVRLSGSYYDQSEGFYYNPFLDNYLDETEELLLRAVVLYELTDAWELVLQADYFNGERAGNLVYAAAIQEDPFTWAQDDENRSTRETQNYYASLNGDLGWAELDVIVNYRERNSDRFYDDDLGVAQSPFDETQQVPCFAAMMGMYAANQRCTTDDGGTYEKLSFEARLTGSAGDLDWIAGVDALEASDFFYQNTPGRSVNSYELDLSNDVTSWSVFGGGEYAFTSRLSAGFEGRWTDEEKDLDSFAFLTEPPVAGVVAIDTTSVEEFGYFTWAGFASYDFSNRLRGFARVGSGFRSGGLNTDARDIVDPDTNMVVEVPDFYDEERAISYELGFKSEPTDFIVLNGAVYFIQYQDFISNANNGLSGLDRVNYVTNLGDAELFGAELELAGRNITIGEKIDVDWGLGLAYGEGEVTDATDPSNEGLIISRMPEWSWTGHIKASRPVTKGAEAFVAVNYSGQSGGYQTYANTVDLPEPQLVNVNVGLDSKNWRLQASFINVTDEDELVRNPSGAYENSLARDPRTWRVKLTRRF